MSESQSRSEIDLAFRSATELAAALRARRVGCEELLEHYLARAARWNPAINAIVAWDVEGARERARRADAALARGESWGPLHGVPMTIKDSIEVAGMPTTSGAPALREHRPAAHAPAAQRAIDAGAVVFGKTNLPIYAGDFQSYNDVYGVTRNPWNPERTPGGSSGGSAAALAAGLTGLEIGSDIGGSIRNPSHFCGTYGLKPSYGLVPTRGHVPGPPGTLAEADLAVIGPMARSAADLALGLDVLAGPDRWDARAWRVELPPPRADRLRDFRVAAWLDHPQGALASEVAERLHAAVDAIARAGAHVDAAARPVDGDESFALYLRMLYGVLANGFPPALLEGLDAAWPRLASEDTGLQANLVRGVSQRHRDWLRDAERRARLRAAWDAFFRDFDVLLAPVMPTAAFAHDHSDIATRTIAVEGKQVPYFQQLFWAGVVGVVHLPSVVAPVGRTPEGLPVGVQIVAPYLEDRTAIRFAERLAEAIGGFVAPPGFA
ncbi:MAG: amidase [Proteobacteria bacterium]|nr:MAG: amidase [Pseudomonadota bacterium]